MPELIYKEEVYAIVGAAMKVHRHLGHGFAEGVYQECFEVELAARGIAFESQKELPILYKGKQIQKTYIADLVVQDNIIVELKALDALTSREEAQVINYLKASKRQVGVLLNFGAPSLEWKRLVKTDLASIDLSAAPAPLDNSRSFAKFADKK